MLFVSFWNVTLDNFPEGTFLKRRLSVDEARSLIEEARDGERLICVCAEDLLAPYNVSVVES